MSLTLPQITKDDSLILSNDIVVNTTLNITPSISGNFLTIASRTDSIPILQPRTEKDSFVRRSRDEDRVSRSLENQQNKESPLHTWYGMDSFASNLDNNIKDNSENGSVVGVQTGRKVTYDPSILGSDPSPSSSRSYPSEKLTSESVSSQMDFLKKQLLNEIRKRNLLEEKVAKKVIDHYDIHLIDLNFVIFHLGKDNSKTKGQIKLFKSKWNVKQSQIIWTNCCSNYDEREF